MPSATKGPWIAAQGAATRGQAGAGSVGLTPFNGCNIGAVYLTCGGQNMGLGVASRTFRRGVLMLMVVVVAVIAFLLVGQAHATSTSSIPKVVSSCSSDSVGWCPQASGASATYGGG